MLCDRASQVHAYHDGEMPAEQVRSVEAHLRDCPDCRELLGELRKLSTMVFAAPMADISSATLRRLTDKAWYREQDRGVLRISSWMTGIAAAVLIGATLFWPGSTTGPGNTPVATNFPQTSTTTWEVAAVMPPAEPSDEPVSDVMLTAQWMANDLAPAER